MSHFERRAGGPRVEIGGPSKKAAPAAFVVCVDSREQRPAPMPEGVVVEKWTLETGDYTTPTLQAIAVIERKSVGDFASSITRDRGRFEDELRRMLAYRWRCIVVEGDLSEVYRASLVHPHSVLGSIASFFARGDCPCLFAVNPHGAGRLICGILRRWEERVAAEIEAAGAAPTFAGRST